MRAVFEKKKGVLNKRGAVATPPHLLDSSWLSIHMHIFPSFKKPFLRNSSLLMQCSAGEVVLKLSCILFRLFCFWVFKSFLHLREPSASLYYPIFFNFLLLSLGFHDQSLLRHFDTSDIKRPVNDSCFY